METAIVGIAFRFPGANDKPTFWSNLAELRSSIALVPRERWDWRSYWGDPRLEVDKSNSKWGGFIDCVDAFDAEFFGILPKIVQNMDPQQRIMLELAWTCLEDAGIPPSSLRGRKVGVYSGFHHLDYRELLSRERVAIEFYNHAGTASMVIPNRISHLFGFRGPSLSIDTACSSALNAIHAAIQSLECGESELALAGGVNLMLSAERHVAVSKMGTLSPTGSCKTLDERADGYVRGEGAGLLLLKPLARAIEDNDPIYAVIKGSAINHCGQTHTLSYPSLDAQADVIVTAHEQAGVPISSVNFVEMHGTGTAKGDPIEFEGLLRAFTRLAERQSVELPPGYCGLSSAKTNIGHLEAAAGLAGIVKVLLAFRHRQMPGFHDFRTLNSRVAIEGTPFRVLDKTVPWLPAGKGMPLRACVSSFGFGGTNAHLVLEEPPQPARVKPAAGRRKSAATAQLFALSAKTADALERRKRDLLTWLRTETDDAAPAEVARALLLDRDHLQHRYACVAESLQELQAALAGDREDAPAIEAADADAVAAASGEAGAALIARQKTLKKSAYAEGLRQLAALFLGGADLPWAGLFDGGPVRGLRLPTYPFARTRHSLPDTPGALPDTDAPAALHPLLHRALPIGDRARFVSKFNGGEFFLADHIVGGQRTLPAVAYLEMIRAAAEAMQGQARGVESAVSHSVRFADVVWLRPLTVDDMPVEVEIELIAADPQGVASGYEFQVARRDADGPAQTLCRGRVDVVETGSLPAADADALARERDLATCSGEEIQAAFATLGLEYGAGHRGLREVRVGDGDGLGLIELPAHIASAASRYVLHPGIADAAFQAAVVFDTVREHDGRGAIRAAIPFALDELRIFSVPAGAVYALVRRAVTQPAAAQAAGATHKLDIDLIDATEGLRLCATVRGLSMLPLGDATEPTETATTVETPQSLADSLYLPEWKSRPATPTAVVPTQLVLIGERESLDWVQPLLAASPRFAGTRFGRIALSDAADAAAAGGPAVRPGVLEDYQGAVAALNAQGIALERVLMLPSRTGVGGDAEQAMAVARSAFALAKAMLRGTKSARYVQLAPAGADAYAYLALGGLFKTLRIEKPTYSGCVVECDPGVAGDARLADIVADELFAGDAAVDVRYRDGVRETRGFSAVAGHSQQAEAAAGFREGGVYLLTGGLGAIGRIVAAHLCARYRAKVYLTGRSEPTEAQREILAGLIASGGEAVYLSCDVADRDSVRRAIARIREDGHRLHGVLHSAGVIEDGFVLRKTSEQFARVIAPKIAGTLNLDLETREEPLEMFVLFSSVAGVLGNVGQCDYACGNAFEDAYAHAREALRLRGERSGKALSVNWPFWLNGGMRLGESELEAIRRNFGIVPLTDAQGLDALEFGLTQPHPQMVVMPGDAARVRDVLGARASESVPAAGGGGDAAAWRPAVSRFLSKSFAEQLRISSDFDSDKSFKDYGFDSVVMIELIAALEKTFGTLPKTLFFEYPTLGELSGYFVEQHAKICSELAGETPAQQSPPPQTASSQAMPHRTAAFASVPASVGQVADARAEYRVEYPVSAATQAPEPIAVIGLAGRYPQADSLEELWQNLKNGCDCVEEVPPSRGDLANGFLFQPGEPVQGKSYAKWGGLLRDVDMFDPLFFNISPKEADDMDPNERLFLEAATQAIEDAGYTPQSLCPRRGFKDRPVGVYVGIMWGDYQLHGVDAVRENWVTPHSFYWEIANRVSYVFDFSGPSLAIDTACSSSLTAIHLACQAMRQGEIDLAIVGASNLSLHPNKYNLLSNMHFMSGEGRCRSFGEGGNGYVPGEGVGAALLKPLSRARADGDHIYGMILGSAVNHGGKSTGFTVPNVKRQADLIQDALASAGISPRELSYIEAHGTGTKLGDPIEINALTKAFGAAPPGSCPIGSCKSNLGHLEAAAGIVALSKVLLQMKHRLLVPSIHSETLNPFIEFDRTPFYVQRTLQEWRRPVVAAGPGDSAPRELPRIAGISSFGAGGSNGHLIVGEYIDVAASADPHDGSPLLFVLSARKEPALVEAARRLAGYLVSGDVADLRDVAYTLQVGRVGMEYRLALLAGNATELKTKLDAYAAGGRPQDAFTGARDNARRDDSLDRRQSRLDAELENFGGAPDWRRIATEWVDGVAVDWIALNRRERRRRVPLPSYAFQRQRYWVEKPAATVGAASLHPLIDANVSTLDAQSYRKTLRPEEFFLRDHRLGDNRVLPGVAYLEMALQAGRLARPDVDVHAIADVEWHRAVMLRDEPKTIGIDLAPDGARIAFEVHSGDGDARTIHAHGYLEYDAIASEAADGVDPQAVVARCKAVGGEEIAAAFARMGFGFGPSFQVFERLHYNGEEALAELRLPPEAGAGATDYVLHPALLDGALRSTLGIGGLPAGGDGLRVPVAMRRIAIRRPVRTACYAYARRLRADSAGRERYDILLLDAQGAILARIDGLTAQAAPQLALAAKPVAAAPAAALTAALPAQATKPVPAATRATDDASEPAAARRAVVGFLRDIVAQVVRLPAIDIDPSQPLENYGIDSVMIVKLTGKLQDCFGDVSKTLFFEYQDLDGIADHLSETYPDGARSLAEASGISASPTREAPPAISPPPAVPVVAPIAAPDVDRATSAGPLAHLEAAIRRILGREADTCTSQTPIADWPLDPVAISMLLGELRRDFAEVDALAPYRHTTLAEWARTLRWKDGRPHIEADSRSATVAAGPGRLPAFARAGGRMRDLRGSGVREGIAIVGLSGHYAGAADLREYWRNLADGRDSISEIPSSRWDYRRDFHPDRSRKGSVYSKWGGFMDDVDRFDAAFFNVSAREAIITDPQERVFLQTAWECVEDACYTRQSLKDAAVGVFVGVTWGHYTLVDVSEEQLKYGRQGPPFASIANRVSYFMNFSGPSLAVDTMCSSALTALHLACRAIEDGDCDAAIAGGVNLILHPVKYQQLATGQFLSTDGRCRAFGAGGDGYVPGEGVGAVLLKPLSDAERDGDHIYGVIHATSVNHGGKTNGYTVPNQVAQTNVIGKALRRAGWDPRSIDYIEAHGTGTSLGDPIEIAGLSRAFSTVLDEIAGPGAAKMPPQGCRIGSVKSNIGHLESAAAIAGLTKILLQFRHRAIAPSLHSSTPNPNIDFARTPFRVVQALEPWTAAQGRVTRRAGLSSFGAGGANAHCLIEDYPLPAAVAADRAPTLFVLSADSEERLDLYLDRIIDFLGTEDADGIDLRALAWSSQIGREAMGERIAVAASEVGELRTALRAYRDGAAAANVIRGSSRRQSEKLESIVDDAEKDALIRSLIGSGRLLQLGRAWISMLEIDWARYREQLYPGGVPRRMPFPTMPFVTERYWVEEKAAAAETDADSHPLIGRNISTFSTQAYRKHFDGSEFYLRDHIVHTDHDRKILPGVAYLEMARATGQLAFGEQWRVDRIRNLVWIQPFEVSDAGDSLEIRFDPSEETVGFEIVRGSDGGTCVEGELGYRPAAQRGIDERLDIAALRARGTLLETGHEEIYAAFQRMGFHFGPAFRVTQARYRVGEGALCRLRLPEHLRTGLGEFALHPSLLDAALRSGLAVGVRGVGDPMVPIVPFALDEMEFRHPLTEECYAYVVRSRRPSRDSQVDPELTTYKFDIVVTDAEGLVLVKLNGFSGRALVKQQPNQQRVMQYFGYEWQPAPMAGMRDAAHAPQTLLVVGQAPSAVAAALRTHLRETDRVVPVVLAEGLGPVADPSEERIDPFDTFSANALFERLRDSGRWPTRILYCDDADASSGEEDRSDFAGDATPSTLHRGIQAVRRIFSAAERVMPGAAIRLLYAYRADPARPQPQHDAVSGYARSLLTVNHRFELSVLQYDRFDRDACAAIFAAEFDEAAHFGGNEIAYREGTRYRRALHPLEMAPASVPMPGFVDGGTYLITGGGGKLGLLVAQHIAGRCKANLVLSGRSAEPSAAVREAIEALRGQGARAAYYSADTAEIASIEAMLADAEAEFGPLRGVIHCAGVASKRLIVDLDDREFAEILAPKVEGLVLLDRATAGRPLDFFMNFSSVSSQLGDLGACAYAVGNRFMDTYVLWRDGLRAQGLRHGRSLSINWPLWSTGGMEIRGSDASLFGFSGMQALSAAEGLGAMDAILASAHDRVLVSIGDPQRVARTLRLHEAQHHDADAGQPLSVELKPVELKQVELKPVAFASAGSEPSASGPAGMRQAEFVHAPKASSARAAAPPAAAHRAGADLRTLVERYVIERIAEVTRTRIENIGVNASFEQCGMDSVQMLEMHAAMRRDFQDLPKTALFEFDTARRMAQYLIEHAPGSLHAIVGHGTEHTSSVAEEPAPLPVVVEPVAHAEPVPRPASSPFKRSLQSGRDPGRGGDEGIAIVGVAGEFPSSPDLARFWANLREGRDCLIRVPEDRGFASALNRHRSRSGKTIADKGGFIDDVDSFDPKLFRMSQAEADKADPQLRVMLRAAWRAIEDASYAPESLSGARIGVFVGSMNEDFTWIAAELQARTADYLGPGSVSSELSNRISFLLNLNGPSVTVSTACASSLTALHLARQSILSGDCDAALVGGVNLSLHQSKYRLLHDMKVLSPDGYERTFDESANGLVPSEGVAAVMLKRLGAAIADGDHIYGVIRASRIGHAGTGAGQFLPNLRVMEQTAAECLRDAGLNADDVTYVETHGTGTELGDPIELKALANALRRTTATIGHCAIGSKANIGHMEAASGLGSLIKVLLSMRHGEIAPCARLRRINSSFDHARSPFYFPSTAVSWPRNARGSRVAGINSFGMGGSNAFVVVESFEPSYAVETAAEHAPALFVLSARSPEALRHYAGAFVERVRKAAEGGLTATGFADFAYSTQVGRAEYNHRLAMVAAGTAELVAMIEAWLRDDARRPAGVYSGDTEAPAAAEVLRLLAGEAGDDFIGAQVRARQLDKLAELWVRGAHIEWSGLHPERARRRVPFPGVPFESVRCDLRSLIDSSSPVLLNAPTVAARATVGGGDLTDGGHADDGLVATGWRRLSAFSDEDAEAADPTAASVDSEEDLRRTWVEYLGDAADTAIECTSGFALDDSRRAEIEAQAAGMDVHCVSELVDDELVRILRTFGARHDIAIETLIAAAWAVLVNRHTKARFSQFGLLGAIGDAEPAAGDGFAATLLPVRVRTVGRQKMLEWLSELQASLLRKHRRAQAPIERIGEWVGRLPLFDSVVVFDAAARSVAAESRHSLVSESHPSQPRPRIELVAMVRDESLELSLIYRAAEPNYDNASTLLEQFKVLLEGIATNPDKMPSALGMRTRAESRDRFWKVMEAVAE